MGLIALMAERARAKPNSPTAAAPLRASRSCAPDLLIAFDVGPETYHRGNDVGIAEQGKRPNFVLEVASASATNPPTMPPGTSRVLMLDAATRPARARAPG